MGENCCEVVELQLELNNLTEKLKLLKQDYHQLLIENLQKDLILRRLKSKLNKEKFASFIENLTKSCIDKLNCVGEGQREDSRFIALVLYDLYNEDLESIKKLSLSSRSRKDGKTEISAENRSILENIFAERLHHIPQVAKSRKFTLSKLLRNAIEKAKRN